MASRFAQIALERKGEVERVKEKSAVSVPGIVVSEVRSEYNPDQLRKSDEIDDGAATTLPDASTGADVSAEASFSKQDVPNSSSSEVATSIREHANIELKSKQHARLTPKERSREKIRMQWNDSWIFEQERRSSFERKLQSNEAWWPAALQVMNEAASQNDLLCSIIDKQLKMELQAANSLGDIAVASSGITFNANDSREQEIARIAATTVASSSDLAPGRILSQLSAEIGTESLRRLRTANQCHKILIDERLSPMVSDFNDALAVEANKGTKLLKVGRDINIQVRNAFEAYDEAARRSQRISEALIVQKEEDVWLLNLRWRLACVWQGSLWKEITRRFRAQFESLHKIEHNRRIMWNNSFEAWNKTVLESYGSEPCRLPITEELGRNLKLASASSTVTHSEMMSAIKRKVPASLADLAPSQSEKEDDSHKLHYSPIVGNPLVIKCEMLEHRTTYGGGLMSSWESCCAVLTINANLMLFPVAKDTISKAAQRHSVHTQTKIVVPPCHVVLAEHLAALDPAGPPLPANHTRAAEVAAAARAEAAKTGPMPMMPDKLTPGTCVSLRNCVIDLSSVSRSERMFDISEEQEGSGLFGFFPTTATRITTLRAKDENILRDWVNLLRGHTKQESPTA